jgi:hypothetical protein
MSMRKKAALALGTVCVTVAALELAARLYMPLRGPVLLREGYYENPLPLITGPIGDGSARTPAGERLPEAKAPGELRVFVLGESSVWGAPLDTAAAMPAMLLDDLRARAPGRRFTVVNMGRPGSISANVYYYLLFIRRYSPDFVVFYMGMNDSDSLGGEQCLLAAHPAAHAAWRPLVERSWLLWTARAFGPTAVWAVTGKWRSELEGRDCAKPPFPAWTRLLVETARKAGAKAVIATPVQNVAEEIGPQDLDPAALPAPSTLAPAYRRLLACELSDGCDFSAALEAAFVARHAARKAGRTDDPKRRELEERFLAGMAPERRDAAMRGRYISFCALEVEDKARAWREAADAGGAEVVEFHRVLTGLSPRGLLSEKWFSDSLRLRPEGYLLLARLIGSRIAFVLDGVPERPASVPRPGDAAGYVEAARASGVHNVLEQFRYGRYMSLVPGLKAAATAYSPRACARKGFCDEIEWDRLALGWLRREAGLPHGLRPPLAARLPGFSPLNSRLDETHSRILADAGTRP